MKEIAGQLWDYYNKEGFVVCITTNGTIKKNGEAVMGRGCAYEARKRFPGLPEILGKLIKRNGNIVQSVSTEKQLFLISFPVKHKWWEDADLSLIEKSMQTLKHIAKEFPARTIILPRPGCGNGNRQWSEVEAILSSLPDNVHIISWYLSGD